MKLLHTLDSMMVLNCFICGIKKVLNVTWWTLRKPWAPCWQCSTYRETETHFCSQQVFSIKASSGCQDLRWRSTTSRTPSREVRRSPEGHVISSFWWKKDVVELVLSVVQVMIHWLTRRATMTSTLWLECWSSTSGVWRTRCFPRKGLMTSSPASVSITVCLSRCEICGGPKQS